MGIREVFGEQELLIIDSFLKLMYDNPYDKITVKELTQRCSIARTTFYRYFEDTYDLMERIERYLLEELSLYHSKRVQPAVLDGNITGESLLGKPYESTRHWFETALRLHPILACVMGENGDVYFKERLIARIRRELSDMMDDEHVRNDKLRPYYVAAIAASHVGLLHFIALRNIDELLSADELATIVNSMRVAYFRNDQGAPKISDSQLFGANS